VIVPPAILRKYGEIEPYIRFVEERVESSVLDYCRRHGFAYAARVKTPDSLAEKLETGRYRSWSEIDDLFGCTIVVPTLLHEEAALEFLRSAFNEVETRSRRNSKKDPLLFRFDATRFIGTLRNLPDDANAVIQSQRFEVQIRSAFEHAWSVATHALAYKGNSVDWRVMRLASQLKAAVEQLDTLIIGFEQAAEVIATQDWPEVQSTKAVEVFFRELVEAGSIPSEIVPSNWPRFAENVFSLIRQSNGFRRDQMLDSTHSVLAAIREEILPIAPEMFPRSISLGQFVLGLLTRMGRIRGEIRRYTPLVTDELIAIFPATDSLTSVFDFEVTDE